MVVPSREPQGEGRTDPLQMEWPVNSSGQDHVIDITTRSSVASSSGSRGDHITDPDALQHDRPLSSSRVPTSQSSSLSSTISNSRNASSRRRGDSYGRRHRNPLNSGLWISIELVITVSQIIASVVVLSLSRHEKPRTPLFAWIVGYAAGCVATLPLLYWRYLHRNNQGAEQESTRTRQSSAQNNLPTELSSYNSVSVPWSPVEEGRRSTGTRWWNRLRTGTGTGTGTGTPSLRLSTILDHFKMALDCFFAVWFVVGNVWIFGGHSSSSGAPNLYRLCIVFLTFSCIGYAMPFILCAAICCCLPCIISVLGFREDLGLMRGATQESISILPTYKFKLKRCRNRGESEINLEGAGAGEGGILAAGTDKERIISAEDAVCCICLAKYIDNDELRELPCTHFFHTECVDKWLKINASCPLCKYEVGESAFSLSCPNSVRRQGERMVGNGATAEAYGSIIY